MGPKFHVQIPVHRTDKKETIDQALKIKKAKSIIRNDWFSRDTRLPWFKFPFFNPIIMGYFRLKK